MTVGGIFLSKVLTDRLSREYLEVSEYEFKFSLFRFIKMFLTTFDHFCFGILTTFVIMLIDGYGFACNQFYWGIDDLKFVILNHIDHLTFLTIFIAFAAFPTEHVEGIDLIFPIITYVSRSFIIACRYSLMSDARWEIMQKQNPQKWVKSDFIKRGWERLDLTTLLTEIKASKYRLKIENDDFNFTFDSKLSNELHEKLIDIKYYQKRDIDIKKILTNIKTSKRDLNIKRKTTMKWEKQRSLFAVSISNDKQNLSKKDIELVKTNGKDKATPHFENEWAQNRELLKNQDNRSIHELDSTVPQYQGDAIFREICLLE